MRFGSGGAPCMQDSRMMLADFGIAVTKVVASSGSIKADHVNSTPYRPPELIERGCKRTYFGAEVDVWAAAATAYECASQGNPRGPKIYVYHHYMKGFASPLQATGQALKRLAPEDKILKEFITNCVSRGAARRPTAAAALQDLLQKSGDMIASS